MGEASDSSAVMKQRPRKRVTITDLAASLGLAKGTVSRALNGYPDIAASTRQRVSAAARTMGYSPMAHAQAIRTGRVRAVGLVLQLDDHDAQRAFIADFLKGITQAASAEGWTLTVATADSGADGLDTYRRLIEERKADGFILPRTRVRDPRIEFLRALDVPFVLYGRTGDPTGCAWFDIRGGQAMAEAVARLVGLGHRRIGFIGGDPELNYAHLRLQGYKAGLRAAGLPVLSSLIRSGGRTSADGRRAAQALLNAEHRPTAIVCATDLLAIGVAKEAKSRGLVLGQDLSLIGYDGGPDAENFDPPLTTFVVDQFNAGAQLARLLIARIRGVAPEDLRETEIARLSPGETDGPPAAPILEIQGRIET